jgi:hypothetical protein
MRPLSYGEAMQGIQRLSVSTPVGLRLLALRGRQSTLRLPGSRTSPLLRVSLIGLLVVDDQADCRRLRLGV